jgi:hypothetical protein
MVDPNRGKPMRATAIEFKPMPPVIEFKHCRSGEGWTSKELELLIRGVVGYKSEEGWGPISKLVGRSANACLLKWRKIKEMTKSKPISHKVVWSDDMMENLEKLHALKYDWKLIAQILDVPDYMECKYRWQRIKREQMIPSADDEADLVMSSSDDSGEK